MFASVLALDEPVCDAEDGVDDYGVDAFGDLVLSQNKTVSILGFEKGNSELKVPTYVNIDSIIVENTVGYADETGFLDNTDKTWAQD